MLLQTELDRFQAGWRGKVGDEIANAISQDNARLLASGLADRALKAGDRLPDVTLPNAVNQPVSILSCLEKGPVVITFYRGGWCPYCSLELRAYQATLAEIRAAGGDLIAVSPETPDNALSTAEKNALSFTVLSDAGGLLADALGIRFDIADPIIALYQQFGHDLPQHNGDGRWSLPIPATYVVGQNGIIQLAFVDPDYRKRLDPAEAVKAIRQLAGSSRLHLNTAGK